MQYSFEVTFQEKKQLSKDIYEVYLKLEQGEFHFKPGQYIWLIIPNLNVADKKGNRRLFYISSVPNKNQIVLIAKDTGSGYKNSLLSLQNGAKLSVAGPFGSSFVLESTTHSDVVFIAEDTLIAPFLCILRSGWRAPNNRPVFLLFYNQSGDFLYKEELEEMQSQNIIVLTTIKDNFSWETSNLSQINPTKAHFFVNGKRDFVNSVTSILHSKGVQKETIFFGENYPILEKNISSQEIEKFISDKSSLGFLAIEQSNHHIVITDSNGVILFANGAAQNITGYSKDELLSSTPRLWGGIMGQAFYKNFWERLKTGKAFIGQMTNRRKNGQPYHVISNIAPIVDSDGNVTGFIDTEEDITQQIFFEEHLKVKNITIEQEHQRVSALLESLGEGVIAIDLNGMILNVNPTTLSMLGFTQQEMLGKSFVELVKAEDDKGNIIPIEDRGVTKALKSGKRTQTISTYIRKDGTKFVAGIISSPIFVDKNLYGIITVFRDVTKEREIDRAKTEFISLASHQLRTPLSAIKWFLGMLLAGDAGNLTTQQNEMMQNVYKSNERMIALVNSLLDVSRIESGRIIVDPVPTDLRELLEGIKQDLFAKLKEKNQTLNINIEENLPKINLDPLLIRQVYLNLLTNSLKYSSENTQVEVTVKKQEENLMSSVKDMGYGIPIEEKDKVFTKLYRGENVLTKVIDGNGLGLYLVKQIVESSKGKIWFESEENKGTTFWFTIPIIGMQKKEGEVKLNS